MMDVAGTSFSRLVEQYVFQPAGMARSARTHRDLPLREDLAAAIAIPYHVDSTGMMVRSPEKGPQGDGAAGGVISTVLDLARFDVALDRGELISPGSYTAMMRPMRSHAGASLPYSVGWFAQRHAGHELRWHSGWWPDAYSALYLARRHQGCVLGRRHQHLEAQRALADRLLRRPGGVSRRQTS